MQDKPSSETPSPAVLRFWGPDLEATHARELADIASKCCADLLEEATGNMIDHPTGESRTEQPAKRAGCCCSPSKEVTKYEVDRPIAEKRVKQPAKDKRMSCRLEREHGK